MNWNFSPWDSGWDCLLSPLLGTSAFPRHFTSLSHFILSASYRWGNKDLERRSHWPRVYSWQVACPQFHGCLGVSSWDTLPLSASTHWPYCFLGLCTHPVLPTLPPAYRSTMRNRAWFQRHICFAPLRGWGQSGRQADRQEGRKKGGR